MVGVSMITRQPRRCAGGPERPVRRSHVAAHRPPAPAFEAMRNILNNTTRQTATCGITVGRGVTQSNFSRRKITLLRRSFCGTQIY